MVRTFRLATAFSLAIPATFSESSRATSFTSCPPHPEPSPLSVRAVTLYVAPVSAK
jgi:hypothetical protein